MFARSEMYEEAIIVGISEKGISYMEFFFVKGPAADATDAPQP
jgi:hypothetical protein